MSGRRDRVNASRAGDSPAVCHTLPSPSLSLTHTHTHQLLVEQEAESRQRDRETVAVLSLKEEALSVEERRLLQYAK